MTTVFGAAAPALRDLSTRLTAGAAALDEALARLGPPVEADVWRGPDAAAFRAEWGSRLRPALGVVGRALGEAAAALLRQADEQERASGAAGVMFAGPGGGLTAPSAEVKRAWAGLDEQQRLRVLQGLLDAHHERLGLEPVSVGVMDLDGAGSPERGNTIGGHVVGTNAVVIDPYDLPNADVAIDAAFHEARHVAQYEIVADMEAHPLNWWDHLVIGVGLAQDPWGHPGESRAEAAAWRANQADYLNPAVVGFDAYWSQPVEVDAREAARAAVPAVTAEQVERLARG